MRLFDERVRDVLPLRHSENGATASNLQKLEALPLALIAAPWMKTLTADDLLRRLTATSCSCPRRARSSGAPADDERHDRLELPLPGPNEQRTFRRLGVLAAFQIEAAAAESPISRVLR